MTITDKEHKKFILSSYPQQVTVGDLEGLLNNPNSDAKNKVADFIYHRLYRRYLNPLLHVPNEHKSGFLIMASACLLIETIEAFYKGNKQTPKKNSTQTFEDFFKRENDIFPGFENLAGEFYKNIRCGILHQAETCGGYRILRKGLLLNSSAKTINADVFAQALVKSLDRYVSQLRHSKDNSELWINAQKKVKFICANCQK